MATPLKDKIRSAAIATPALTALLGTNPFRWYDTQLYQGTTFPAVVVQIVTSATDYCFTGAMATGFSRVQFTLWGLNNASGYTSLASLEAALRTFFASLNLVGIPNAPAYSNLVSDRRDGFYAKTDPGNPLVQLDARIFNNDSL